MGHSMSLFHRRRVDDGRDDRNIRAPRSPRETMRIPERDPERLTPPPDGQPAVYPLDETCELQVRRLCWRCHGKRHVGPPLVACVVCQARYTADELRSREWRYMLPCGHALPGHERAYRPQTCPTCAGDGELYAWITLGDWLDWLATHYPDDEIEDGDMRQDTDVSLRTTRRRRVV